MKKQGTDFLSGRILVVAFEGWNDAGEAATGAVRLLREQLDVGTIAEIDPEDYFDFQFNRPVVSASDDGKRTLTWPGASVYGPTTPGALPHTLAADAEIRVRSDNSGNVYLLVGTEPSRRWKAFVAWVMSTAHAEGVTGIILLGAMLADVPHTRPIAVKATSENSRVRSELSIDRSAYEGPVGILSVIAQEAEASGIPTVSLWASVPHYVHNSPSPKATLALLDKLEEYVDVVIPRGSLVDEAASWESGINALANDDDDMATYIKQLEQARDTVDSPSASGDAIAEEFERYLRKRGDTPDGSDRG